MSERAGDSAATVNAGETANRPAEETPAAPSMEGDFEAPDNIRDIDNALADVAEDLARLEQASVEPARESRSFRADSSLNDALGTVSRDLDPEQDTVTADSVEDLDNQLSGMDESSGDASEEGVDDAIGQIFDSRASAVRRKAAPQAPPATPKSLPPDPKRNLEFDEPQAKASPGAPENEPEDEVEIEIEEVAEPAGSFQAPDDILPGPAPSKGATAPAAAAPPPAGAFTVPERRPEDHEASGGSVEEFEIEIEEMDAAEAAPPPTKATPVAAKPAAAKAAPEAKPAPIAKAAPEPPKADALAQAAEAAAASREAAKVQTAKSSRLGSLLTPLIMLLVVINKPFGKMSRATRDTLGLLGAGTLFNALCAWVYWLLLR